MGANTCKCSGGVAAKGADCTNHDANICASCNPGWALKSKECVANTCKCSGGVAAKGADCTNHDANICASCNPGWAPQKECVPVPEDSPVKIQSTGSVNVDECPEGQIAWPGTSECVAKPQALEN